MATRLKDKLIGKTKELVAEGWRSVRLGPGMAGEDWTGDGGSIYEPVESVDLAVHWIKEVRKAVGPDVEQALVERAAGIAEVQEDDDGRQAEPVAEAF